MFDFENSLSFNVCLTPHVLNKFFAKTFSHFSSLYLSIYCYTKLSRLEAAVIYIPPKYLFQAPSHDIDHTFFSRKSLNLLPF